MLDPHQRSLRVGLAALACALVFRLFSLGLPEKLVAWHFYFTWKPDETSGFQHLRRFFRRISWNLPRRRHRFPPFPVRRRWT